MTAITIAKWEFYRLSRPNASGRDTEGKGRQKINQPTIPTRNTVRNPHRRITDRNPPLTETVWKCDTAQNPATVSATGVVGRGGAADPHGRRAFGCGFQPTHPGKPRGITFACDSTTRFGACGQNGEAAGLAPAVLHRKSSSRVRSSFVTLTTPLSHSDWMKGLSNTCSGSRLTGSPFTRGGAVSR